jgi:hypothetical protein
MFKHKHLVGEEFSYLCREHGTLKNLLAEFPTLSLAVLLLEHEHSMLTATSKIENPAWA